MGKAEITQRQGRRRRRGNASWYVVETEYKQEDTAAKSLRSLDLEVPFLKYRSIPEIKRGRVVRKILPLFEGYLLVRMVDDHRDPRVLFAKGVRRTLGRANDQEVEYILSLIREDGYVHPGDCEPPAFLLGDAIAATTGAFRDKIGEYRGPDPTNSRNSLVCFQLMRREVVASIFRYDLAPSGSRFRAARAA